MSMSPVLFAEALRAPPRMRAVPSIVGNSWSSCRKMTMPFGNSMRLGCTGLNAGNALLSGCPRGRGLREGRGAEQEENQPHLHILYGRRAGMRLDYGIDGRRFTQEAGPDSLPASQNRGHHARAAPPVKYGHNPQRLFLPRVSNHIDRK